MFYFSSKLKNVSCECNRLNGWNSALQAAWYIRHARWACLFYISFLIWCVRAKPKIWLLILSFTNLTEVVRAWSIFNPYEGYKYRLVPLDSARVNRTICHNHSAHWYCITRTEGGDYIKQAIFTWHVQQNPLRPSTICLFVLSSKSFMVDRSRVFYMYSSWKI